MKKVNNQINKEVNQEVLLKIFSKGIEVKVSHLEISKHQKT